MAAVTICSDFGAQKIKSDTVSPSISHEVIGLDAMIFVFWMLSFKPTFPQKYFLTAWFWQLIKKVYILGLGLAVPSQRMAGYA